MDCLHRVEVIHITLHGYVKAHYLEKQSDNHETPLRMKGSAVLNTQTASATPAPRFGILRMHEHYYTDSPPLCGMLRYLNPTMK